MNSFSWWKSKVIESVIFIFVLLIRQVTLKKDNFTANKLMYILWKKYYIIIIVYNEWLNVKKTVFFSLFSNTRLIVVQLNLDLLYISFIGKKTQNQIKDLKFFFCIINKFVTEMQYFFPFASYLILFRKKNKLYN